MEKTHYFKQEQRRSFNFASKRSQSKVAKKLPQIVQNINDYPILSVPIVNIYRVNVCIPGTDQKTLKMSPSRSKISLTIILCLLISTLITLCHAANNNSSGQKTTKHGKFICVFYFIVCTCQWPTRKFMLFWLLSTLNLAIYFCITILFLING